MESLTFIMKMICIIGGIKTESNYKNAEITIGEKRYQLSREKWNTQISENGEIKYNLKAIRFLGIPRY